MAFAEEEEEEEEAVVAAAAAAAAAVAAVAVVAAVEEEAVRFVVVCIKVVITSLLNRVPSLEFISVFPVYFKSKKAKRLYLVRCSSWQLRYYHRD